jgi:ribose-phosphate pyrophosphokinase
MKIIGEVTGKIAVIIDDIVDTREPSSRPPTRSVRQGAQEVIACCTHGVLSGRALERIRASSLKRLVVTDTIPLREEVRALPNVSCSRFAHLIGEAIRRIHNEESISSLFI